MLGKLIFVDKARCTMHHRCFVLYTQDEISSTISNESLIVPQWEAMNVKIGVYEPLPEKGHTWSPSNLSTLQKTI